MGSRQLPQFVASPPSGAGSQLVLHVVYTTPAATRAAIRAAAGFAGNLEARLDLLVPKVVPFPLPLNEPTVPDGFTEEAVRSVLGGCELNIQARILLCRDREETIPNWLPGGSIAVIGRRRRWGPGSFRGLIRSVRNAGHHVVVVDAR